jgi:hypothetical protein
VTEVTLQADLTAIPSIHKKSVGHIRGPATERVSTIMTFKNIVKENKGMTQTGEVKSAEDLDAGTNIRTNLKVGKLPSLSTLGARLREVEADNIENDDGAAQPARIALIKTIGVYQSKRYDVGKALAEYKACFIAERGWMAVVKVIGQAMGCDERTVRRILDDFVRANGVPGPAIEELRKRNIDPAAKKNETIITSLLEMPDGRV